MIKISKLGYYRKISIKSMSFTIASSNNSLGLMRKFNSLDEFVIFYKQFLTEQIDMIYMPLKIGTQSLSNLLR